jgi:hypothetical protein
MRRSVHILLVMALALVLAGCSTPDSRIRERQAAFDRYPENVQQKLRAGTIEVGYTPEMVEIALGEPDRKAEVVTEDHVAEVWSWWTSSPGFGIGVGSFRALGSSVGIGTGVSVGGRSSREEAAVVEFVSGRVRRFEMAPAR